MIILDHIHPMLAHFPIALVIFGFIADFASLIFKKEACLTKTGFYLLLAGSLTALFALIAGDLFTEELTGAAGQLRETHELFAWITLSLLVLTSILRIYLKIKNKEESNLKWLAFSLYAIATISVGVTGYLGGTLVYTYLITSL